jgi:ADP-dependent NAD(P)H-hydrate dehydratase / NAD(P)H-hydrate epimerase
MQSSNSLYSVAEIREVEQAAQAALPPFTLMQRAGDAAARFALELLDQYPRDKYALILAGPGNNGGDALETAANLAHAGMQVTVLLFADAAKQSADSRQALERAKASHVQFGDAKEFGSLVASRSWSITIDGLFGIGLARALESPFNDLIALIDALPCPVLALDVPSGLDADTGNIVGAHGVALRATHTLTFIGDKPGLHTCFGRDHAGTVRIANLNIEASRFKPAHAYLNVPGNFAESLKPRPHNSHKGSYGDAIVVGGAHGMSGAAILAARAAAKCGAGRVFAAFVAEAPPYDSAQPELMCRLAQDMDFSRGTVIIGPGLGTSADARHLLAKTLATDSPLVLDADALNLLASDATLQDELAARKRSALLTPHPLEAARLLQITTAQIQADRPAAARALADRFEAIVVLKGSGTVVAQPGGEIAINTTGNAALATGGTGDVLAGVCGALLAQSWPAWHAARAAVWLHGHAADVLSKEGIGPIGLTATELIPQIRAELNRLIGQYAKRSGTH